jgi:hypothetical protein
MMPGKVGAHQSLGCCFPWQGWQLTDHDIKAERFQGVKTTRILHIQDTSSKLKPSSIGIMRSWKERASSENGTAWCHVVRVSNMPSAPRNHGDWSTLEPRKPVHTVRVVPTVSRTLGHRCPMKRRQCWNLDGMETREPVD